MPQPSPSPYGAISADDHLQEPVTLWQERLPAKLVDLGPKLVELPGGDHAFQIGDEPPKPLDGLVMAGGAIDGKGDRLKVRWENVRPGFWKPADRLADMDLDGVWSTVLYPNMILDITMNQVDVADEALLPIVQVYNDHMSEFCAHDPDRLVGYGILPTQSPEQATAEMKRVRELDHIQGMLLPVKPLLSDWIDPLWEPVWAGASELGLKLSVHGGKPRWLPRRSELDGKGQMMVYMHLGYSSVVEALGQILWSGAFERYPDLVIVSVEADLGWVPHFKRRAEKMFQRHGEWAGARCDPSEIFGRNLLFTFESDPIGLRMRDEIGVESIMWAADYPHSASSFPGSMQQIADDLSVLSAAEREQITWGNVQRLYAIPDPPSH